MSLQVISSQLCHKSLLAGKASRDFSINWPKKAAVIVEAILAARSPRLSEIAQHMPGRAAANYKAIQRFLQQVDVKALLLRLFQADAPFVIGDPTEMPRPQARKTSYVGKLKDGKTRGFWLLLVATPFRGRAIPCGFVTYCSKTIAQLQRSPNQYHWAAFDQLKALLGDKPLVLDREFGYLELLEHLAQVWVNFVIRLHLGSHPPIFYDAVVAAFAQLVQPLPVRTCVRTLSK